VVTCNITNYYKELVVPRTIRLYRKKRRPPSFRELVQPVEKMLHKVPALESKGDRPLKMFFEDQLNALIFFHLEEHVSGRHLFQVLKKENILSSASKPTRPKPSSVKMM
jgi:hypothetical protein